ncbi:MAG: hypothetical protein JWQ21_1871 [Herminiimonas sp.]|nr:hypothetical protein [Herminiimonas sp.]
MKVDERIICVATLNIDYTAKVSMTSLFFKRLATRHASNSLEVKNSGLELYLGEKVLAYLDTEELRSKWKTLYQSCSWATSCQHPDFVLSWYKLYMQAFLPVAVIARNKDGELIGLLTLALTKDGRRLVGAGEVQAEYQCWLETEHGDRTFMTLAIRMLRAQFPGIDLVLRYLPPDTPVGWFADDPELHWRCVLISHRCPLLKIDVDAAHAQLKKKYVRRNCSLLEKYGKLRFERITDPAEFSNLFNEICNQYDVRQGATYGVTPFFSDPLKKPFHIELHKQGLLHATVLRAGERIAASHCGLISKEHTLHLGIPSHSPFLSSHSPGSLHLMMLQTQMAQEGLKFLDLTPGGNRFKEHLATAHDVVFELRVHDAMRARWSNEALVFGRRFLKNHMEKIGIDPIAARATLRNVAEIRTLGFRGMAERARQAPIFSAGVYRYSEKKTGVKTYPLSISRDSLADLIRFDFYGSAVMRQKFLSTAMDRLERSKHFYTYRENETLLICCWIDEKTAQATCHAARRNSVSSENAIALFDLYVHRSVRKKQLVQSFIGQMLSELKMRPNGDNIYLIAPRSRDLRKIIEECGFGNASAAG